MGVVCRMETIHYILVFDFPLTTRIDGAFIGLARKEMEDVELFIAEVTKLN